MQPTLICNLAVFLIALLCFVPIHNSVADEKAEASGYLNNCIKQDHRFIKRLVKPGLGFGSYETAWRTLQGYEAMNMIRKGQVKQTEKYDITTQNQFIAGLFGLTA